MSNLNQNIIDRLNNQYFIWGMVNSAAYDGENGAFVFTLKNNTVLTGVFTYVGFDVSHLINVISASIGAAIINYNEANADRSAFIASVSTAGVVNVDLIDYLNTQFRAQRGSLSATYDGINGVLTVLFGDVTYNVNYSYMGISKESFKEVLMQAAAFAIQNFNYVALKTLVEQFTDYTSMPATTIVLDAPVPQLENVFDNVDQSGYPIDGSIGY